MAADMIITRPIPSSGEAMPVIGLGTWQVFDVGEDQRERAPLKDVVNGVGPTTNNEVTVTRYHVEYTRADGRNTPGADVPYPFDGAATGTIPAGGSLTLGFDLVRNVAKQESPLAQLRTSPNIITSIALVTFYGRDRVGNNVSVTGQIQIDFGNFGDF